MQKEIFPKMVDKVKNKLYFPQIAIANYVSMKLEILGILSFNFLFLQRERILERGDFVISQAGWSQLYDGKNGGEGCD